MTLNVTGETMVTRIDIWLVSQGMVATRSKAQELIKNKCVYCNGKAVTKAGQSVTEQDEIQLRSTGLLRYVSRGGLKLERAIEYFGLDLRQKRILDIGSSTGGFTDCALQHGAASVIAVDVGKNIMERSLAQDPRVELHEQTDIRNFPLERFRGIDVVTCDVSFISLLHVAEVISAAEGDFVLIALIKPQFECGKALAKKHKGVVTDKKLHSMVLRRVTEQMMKYSFHIRNITYSPVCGADGNIEYIACFARIGQPQFQLSQLDLLVDNAFRALKKEK